MNTLPPPIQPVIAQRHIDKLKRLFREDGVEIDDQKAFEICVWLFEWGQSVLQPIPDGKEELWEQICREQEEHNLRTWREELIYQLTLLVLFKMWLEGRIKI